MFEKTLTDVVKGIRASKRDTALYISQCIAEIKTEINSSDMYVKANALQKLTFLQMMGYSMNAASFATIEVMSCPRFAHKRIGYLAATQGFTQDTEVILLATNLLKKEISAAVGGHTGNMTRVYEAGLAVNCLSNIVTEDLARDLLSDVTNLLMHSQPYLRKKAILCLFKMFVKYPQGLRLTFAKLQQCLDDSNTAVVSCAVNVITELSDKNPKNYLHLAPAFFTLLTQTSNNWMLIKVIKLLGSLVPEEPRLARKLLEPLAAIVRKTQAKSLLFEAVHTITLCLPYCRKNDGSMPAVVPEIVELSAKTLREFVEDRDQNLKYLGLVGFGSLMVSHPRVLSAPDYRPLILQCLSDPDVTIRTRALDLLTGMVSRKNLIELVTQLMKHIEMATGAYKQDLVAKIIDMCAGEKYALLTDFAWYLQDVLLRLGHTRGIEPHAERIRVQVTDVALRVLPVRTFAVRQSIEILLESGGKVRPGSSSPNLTYAGDNGRGKHIMPEILPALAWIVGEYSDLLVEAMKSGDARAKEEKVCYDDESEGYYHSIVQALTSPWHLTKLPTSTLRIFVQNALKVTAAASRSSNVHEKELRACVNTLRVNLSVYTQSIDPEVADRAFSGLRLLDALELTAETLAENLCFSPVGMKANNDLLDLNGTNHSQPNPSNQPSSTGSPSLAKRLRRHEELLNSLLKPSPMKPIGVKLQRKKFKDPTCVSVDINGVADMSLLAELIDDEISFCNTSKLSINSVNFTQQALSKETELTHVTRVMDAISSETVNNVPNSASSTSFQHTLRPDSGAIALSRPNTNDPFYLKSSVTNNSAANRQGTFGAIELGDSDEEDKAKKKQRKKKKKTKKKEAKDHSMNGLWENNDQNDQPGPYTSAPVFYDSDDEDDGIQMRNRTEKVKEFSGLAQIDLTTPLRDDEVMPERKHHVVVDRPTPEQPGRKEKKAKKGKKKAKKDAIMEDDLLDFGNMASTTSSVSGRSLAATSQPIDTAFDDLLGLGLSPGPASVSPSAPVVSLSHHIANTENSVDPGPWLKASIKSTSGSIDWSRLSAKYQAISSTSGVMITLLFENQSTIEISNLVLELKGWGSYPMGRVEAQSTCLSTKLGPFSVAAPVDLKGKVSSDNGTASLKLVIPCWLAFQPDPGISLEVLGSELGSGKWASSSAKVSLSSIESVDNAQKVLGGYLNASLILGSVDSSTTGFAARASNGAAVRILVKGKDASTLKIDIKSTSPELATALASDMKKLIF